MKPLVSPNLPPGVWLLLAAALFMRAVLPQGVMPEARKDTLVLTLCSGGVMMMPVERERQPSEDEERAAAPCAFAGMGMPALPPPSAADLPLPVPIPLAFGEFAIAASAPGLFTALPPARGPPLPA